MGMSDAKQFFCRAACCKQHEKSHLTHPASAKPDGIDEEKEVLAAHAPMASIL